jgi:hypothetical protein
MALALAGICILAAGCSSNSNRATPTATTSTTAPPVAEAAPDGLLLIVIDIFTDSSTANDPAAVNIAQQIAAKVPSK